MRRRSSAKRHSRCFAAVSALSRADRSRDACAAQSPGQRLDDGERDHADRRIAQRLAGNAVHGDGNVRRPSSTYNPMNIAACSAVAADEHHQPRQRRGHDELLADRARQKPTIDLASPPMPITPLDSAS